jgi:hypothetical protein
MCILLPKLRGFGGQNLTDVVTGPETIRWLHLTDLHVGKGYEAQNLALDNLVAAVEAEAGDREFDLVFLTGDIAFSGTQAEYENFEKRLLGPLRQLRQFQNAQVIASPGNHDLDCDVGLPVSWASLGTSRQGVFFNHDEQGFKTRGSRAQAFSAYSRFLAKNAILGVDPTVEPAKLDKILIRGREIAVVSVVTAFFSDKSVNDRHSSQAPVHPLRYLLGSDLHSQTVVLAHHPITWFSPESGKHFKTLLLEKNVLYLNGHEHEVIPEFGNKGILGVGFGAAYQATLDATKASNYRNSFAVCELDDSLHIKVVSWDSEHGKWRPDENLPPHFDEKSLSLLGGFRFNLPSTKVSSGPRPYAALASAVRAQVDLDACIWLASEGTKRWLKLLSDTGRFREISEPPYNLRTNLATGHHEFRVKDHRGLHLVYCVCGSGDIFNYDQLQSINTDFDTQNYVDCIIATLGTLSEEASTLASKLEQKKPIFVQERDSLIKELIRCSTAATKKFIEEQDASLVKLSMVITDEGSALLRQDRVSGTWFDVINERGEVIPESHETVLRIRRELHEFERVRYSSPDASSARPADVASQSFELGTYLAKTLAYFDDVRYAPLAAIGLKFGKTSLSEIYVSATADVQGSTKKTQTANRAIDELVEALNIPKAQRDQLEAQLRRTFGVDPSSEVGAARQLYQRFNNVVVLGDPGSGKTCFVKYEILAYCQPPLENGSWYTSHLPIYVPLAEASRLISDSTSLLDICAILSDKRGIPLPKSEILKALSEGRAAMFFDGLDEVGFIEKRIRLMSEIEDLYRSQAVRGNRFVIASRPAAVQPVQIPEGMTYLHLKGLTEPEMRVLAGRVLTSRMVDLEGGSLGEEEVALVERLLEDTRHSPGIARIARNPLLLTLLVLIYANTGAAVSAKRHLIYTQAIKTLVSVRGKDTREQQISEADLRTRLGALAVAIFNREIAEIPRRSEVLRVLDSIVGSDLHDESAGNEFLREVAEATGLLVIHPDAASTRADLVTFMHYSFLEYYAAAGLLTRDYLTRLPEVAGNPRWKDVVTLLFGVLSEHGDVTPALQALLAHESPTEQITRSRLLLALECAAECDVPPIAAQQLLARAVANTVSAGAGRVSGNMRAALADKLAFFLQGASAKFELALVEGLQSSDGIAASAFVDLIANLPLEVSLSMAVVEAFAALVDRPDAVTTAAVMFAVERRDQLRLKSAIPAIQRALRGSLAEKHAALKTLSAVPAYYDSCTENVIQLLDDPNDFVASTAAQVVLANTDAVGGVAARPAVIEKLLTKLSLSAEDSLTALPRVTLDRRQISGLVASRSPLEVELALRHISLMRDDPQFVYETLSQMLRTSADARQRAACLDSLRLAPRARSLMTIADTDLVCGMLEAPTRNVRLAAIRLLGEMPDDEQVIRTLQESLQKFKAARSRDEELAAAAEALAKHTGRSRDISAQLMRFVEEQLPSPGRFGDSTEQQHLAGLLTICESLDSHAGSVLASRILAMAEDFRTPDVLRKHALRAYGRVSEPSVESIGNLIRLLRRPDPRFSEAVYSCCLAFVRQCRRKVEHVRRVYPRLGELQDLLKSSWLREVAAGGDSIDLSGARDIRDAVIGIEDLVAQYGEFAQRAQLNGSAGS